MRLKGESCNINFEKRKTNVHIIEILQNIGYQQDTEIILIENTQ